jgi:hypothetical protein
LTQQFGLAAAESAQTRAKPKNTVTTVASLVIILFSLSQNVERNWTTSHLAGEAEQKSRPIGLFHYLDAAQAGFFTTSGNDCRSFLAGLAIHRNRQRPGLKPRRKCGFIATTYW